MPPSRCGIPSRENDEDFTRVRNLSGLRHLFPATTASHAWLPR